MIIEPILREHDKYGQGHYGASRGKRKHRGIDYAVAICPIRPGDVTKLGYCYRDDPFYRYVQVTDKDGYNWRYFYIKPSVEIGQKVRRNTVIGVLQDLGKRYPEITPHIHLEVKKDNEYINPEDLL